jgi:hypothetical protein
MLFPWPPPLSHLPGILRAQHFAEVRVREGNHASAGGDAGDGITLKPAAVQSQLPGQSRQYKESACHLFRAIFTVENAARLCHASLNTGRKRRWTKWMTRIPDRRSTKGQSHH